MKNISKKSHATLTAGAWCLSIFLAYTGVKTYYSTNPSIEGFAVAVLLMIGFLAAMKGLSPIVFDEDQSGFIRVLTFLFVAALIVVDVFAGTRTLHTGTAKKLEEHSVSSQAYLDQKEAISSQKSVIQSLQLQLSECPPKYFKNCINPLSEKIERQQGELIKMQSHLQTLKVTEGADNSFWISVAKDLSALTNNKMSVSDAIYFVFLFLMSLASVLTFFVFGILGESEKQVSHPASDFDPIPPKPTGTDDAPKRQEKGVEKSNGFEFGFQPATAKTTPSPAPKMTRPTSETTPFTQQMQSAHSDLNQMRNTPQNSGNIVTHISSHSRFNAPKSTAPIMGNTALQQDFETHQDTVSENDCFTVPEQSLDTENQTLTENPERTEAQTKTVQDSESSELKQSIRNAIRKGEIRPTVRPMIAFIKEREGALSNGQASEMASGFIDELVAEGVLYHATKPDGTLRPKNYSRGMYEVAEEWKL